MNLSNFQKGVLFTAAGSLGWGISGVCSQYLFSHYEISSPWLTSVRMVLSGIILLLIVLPKAKAEVIGVFKNRSDTLWLFAFALFGLLLCQYTFLGAIKFSNSGTATVLQSLNVVIMAVFMALYSRQKPDLKQLAGIFLAVFGTFLIATNGNPSQMVLSPKGLIFGILSAVGVVSYSLLSRGIIKKYGNILVTGWGMLIGGAVLGIFLKAWIFPVGLDLLAIILIAAIVIIGTAGGFSLFLQGVKYIGPVKATLLGCIEPASATLLSVIFLKTQFGLMEIIGFLAIMATVILSTLKKD